MATIHHLHRGGTVRPIPNLRSVTRDSGAAYLPPVEVEGDKVWREFEAHCRAHPLGKTRQYRIDPPIPLWFRIYIAVALVVSVVLVVVQ